MSRYVQFITPENIEVSYEIAGIGSRFVAALIDTVIEILAMIALILLTLLLSAVSAAAFMNGSAPGWVVAISVLLAFALLFGYHATFELCWHGQTPGKKIARIRLLNNMSGIHNNNAAAQFCHNAQIMSDK